MRPCRDGIVQIRHEGQHRSLLRIDVVYRLITSGLACFDWLFLYVQVYDTPFQVARGILLHRLPRRVIVHRCLSSWPVIVVACVVVVVAYTVAQKWQHAHEWFEEPI